MQNTPKKATVFGGSGFLGSHVADCLSARGWQATIYDIKPSPFLQAGQKMIVGDILDEEKVRQAVTGANVVYNFAGIADIGEANLQPLKTITLNILGNAIIMEALKSQTVERYLFASSLYVYSNKGSFYKDSKLACEMYIEDYHRAWGIPYTILRYGSLYGPRSTGHDRVYLFVKQMLGKKEAIYEGNGEEIREYIHVEDAARCSVEILEGDDYLNGNAIITGYQPMRIRDLMVMIKEIIGQDVELTFKNQDNDLHYDISPYSFKPKLGMKHISRNYIDLGQGILQTIDAIYNELQEK